MSELRYFLGTGQTLEIVLDGDATGGELALMTLRMPPGAGAPPHRHTLESETLVVRATDPEAPIDLAALALDVARPFSAVAVDEGWRFELGPAQNL